MNATVHAVKAQIVKALRREAPVDHATELEAENIALRARIVTLELLLVSSVGVVLAPAPNREVAALHVEDIRKALSSEAPR